MTKTYKRSVAVTAIIAQLLILLPFNIITVKAENLTEPPSTPVLNETIVGTVKFQSFNFLGDNSTTPKEDGIDYSSTFYYTDDFFSRSAINENATKTSMPWTALEDVSMASTSMDFAVASYTTNEGNVTNKGTHSWDNTDYSNKDVNARNFLTDCKFSDFESVNYDRAPQMDSIAYVMAHKEITVFDQSTQRNKTFNLVAVGIRGAGYGAEWASNVTIGDSANPTNVYRHRGFDESAQTVCAGIEKYIRKYNLSNNVKYWVVGFSRSAAVANLTAGYLTDDADKYHTAQKDIYGYTFESPQAAHKSEDLLKYKNIHNIINALDAVPKVSPSGFDHRRLGIDYVMPYYGNTTTSDNTKYYTRMRDVLKTIAVGKTVNGVYTEDPLVAATDPNNYPYNRPLPIYTLTGTQLATDAFNGTMTTNFGTVKAEEHYWTWTGRHGNVDDLLGNGQWYIDRYIDELIQVFLVSDAWDAGYAATDNITTHRTRFIQNYQDSFRTLFGYLLGFSGPPFLSLVNEILTSVQNQIKPTNLLNLTGFLGTFAAFYVSSGTIASSGLKSEAKQLVKKVVNDMTKDYPDGENPDGITQAQMNQAMDKLVDLVVDLYADELREYDSQYFGTTLHYLNEILSVHEQETVLSWNMAVDPNHINRSYRTLTVPKDTTIELHQFREELGETLSAIGEAPVVAEFKNGVQTSSKDQRIYSEISGDKVVIRYPSSLDIRADIRSNDDVDDLYFEVQDYRTDGATTDVSMGETQYERLDAEGVYTSITDDTGAKNINATSNSVYVPMSTKDVLHIMTSGTSSYDDTTAVYDVDKSIYVNTVVEGQYIHDGDDVTFQTNVTDDSGASVTPEFLYTNNRGKNMASDDANAHMGRNFKITIPEVENGHYVEKYYTTVASAEKNRQLSVEGNDHAPADANVNVSDGFQTLTYGQAETMEEILGLQDTVFHVFYSGSPTAPKSMTRIIDFNGKMLLATQAEEPEVLTAQNGTFRWDAQSEEAAYQLKTQKLSDKNVILTSVYESADEALIKGIFDQEDKPVKKKVTVVPANNIYYNDLLMDQTIRAGDGTGYNEDAGTKYQANRTRVESDEAGVSYYFTFTGTGIDIYCTTDSEDGYIASAIFEGAYKNGQLGKRIGSAKTIKNASSVPYVSTPTLRFHPDTGYGTYTVKINAMKGSCYKLDGVRVYGSSGNDKMDPELYGNEKNATFVNLREALINNSTDFTFTTGLSTEENPEGVSPGNVSGILFIDNASALPTLSVNNEALYTTAFAAYKANGPKSEIFLEEDKGIVFCFENYPDLIKDYPDMKLMVGLRLPGSDTDEATVMLGDKTQKITSHLDMYYEVKPDENGIVTITNQSGDMISLTNLKISGTERVLSFDTNSVAQSVSAAPEAESLLLSVGPKTLVMAAKRMASVTEEPVIPETPEESEKPEATEEPSEVITPDPTPEITETPSVTPSVTPTAKPDNNTAGSIVSVLRNLANSIFSRLRSLFR